ncbi:TOM1-like protein 2 [Lycium ferocissimum]|uniref:TOM1-like protein 2 n=1 Tax=Lycium ferocissimum TaxID=112874 RepID=UPI002814D84D|nr:TOM1-like protein 2 [Lycium ferocissimum]
MDKLDKLKMASSSLGERLKTGSAQMSRMVSAKMKEILQGPTPESKMVDEATLETMEQPNWSLNLRICAMINSEEFNGTEVVKAIKKKLVLSKSAVTQRLSLDLLETCSSNCEKVFSEIASEKVLDDMVKMIDDPKSDSGNRVKAMELITAWGESEELSYLPVFRQTYMNLKRQYPLDSHMNEQLLSPPESYPIPDTGSRNHEHTTYIGDEPIEGKKEYLVVTRNSLEILSSILNSEVEPKPIKDDLAVSMLENCKKSLLVIQSIVESTSGDEGLMFEALNLHDELQQVISRYEEMEAALDSGERLPKTPENVSGLPNTALESGERLPKTPENGSGLPNAADASKVNLEKLSLNASESHAVSPTKGESDQLHHEVLKPGISGEERLD